MCTLYDVVGGKIAEVNTFEKAVEFARHWIIPSTMHDQVAIWDNNRPSLGKIAHIDARPGFDWIYCEYRGIAVDM